MIDSKTKEIRDFCKRNSDPAIVKKYSRYFKEGYDGYGIDKDVYKAQSLKWIADWKDEMSLDSYLDLADQLFKTGRYEEKSFAISFIESERANYNETTFNRIGKWFDFGINDWATCDVLCYLVLPHFLNDKIIRINKLSEWNNADSQWQRRAVPVTLIDLVKKGLEPGTIIPLIDPLMPDESEYVRKGLGTLLRELWKKHPAETEKFLMKWKDQCGRLIIQYATEKMDKEYRKKFRKSK